MNILKLQELTSIKHFAQQIECPFFSRAHGVSPGYAIKSFNTALQYMSDHCGIKLEINNKVKKEINNRKKLENLQICEN